MDVQAGNGEGRSPVLFVVDDDQSTIDIVREIANEAGWVVRGFRRLRDLRTSLSRRRPDLLVLDDDLPDGSGGELARDLRSDPNMREMPLVVCTGAHPIRRAEIGDWAPVLSKPFALEEFERVLAGVARRRRRGADQQATG